jgi:hypothetical protein
MSPRKQMVRIRVLKEAMQNALLHKLATPMTERPVFEAGHSVILMLI